MENINWEYIPFNELDIILRLSSQDQSVLDEELSSCLTPLCLACKFRREDLLTILLHHGARTDKCASFCGKLPLHFACDHNGRNRGMVRKLLEANVEINAQDSDGNTGLHMACTAGNIPVVELLIEYGANVNLKNSKGETPLLKACLTSSTELVDILLKAGSYPDVLEGVLAVRSPSVTMLKLLASAGADLDKGSYLSDACEYGHLSIIKVLLENGAKVNRRNILGMSPLHCACFAHESSLSVVRLLLEWGADVHAYTNIGSTALHLTCDIVNEEKIKLLLAYGADANAKDRHKRSPLMKLVDAAQSYPKTNEDRVRIVRLLLAAGSKLPHYHLKTAAIRMLFTKTVSIEFKTLQELFTFVASNPPDLQSQCRIVIRKSVPPNIDENVDKLPLPPQIIRFLKFNDIK